jgi:energy-coupling factor transporter transmembrane protein EcfT
MAEALMEVSTIVGWVAAVLLSAAVTAHVIFNKPGIKSCLACLKWLVITSTIGVWFPWVTYGCFCMSRQSLEFIRNIECGEQEFAENPAAESGN